MIIMAEKLLKLHKFTILLDKEENYAIIISWIHYILNATPAKKQDQLKEVIIDNLPSENKEGVMKTMDAMA